MEFGYTKNILGVINLGVSLTGAQGFTSSGTKGVDHFLVTYPIGG